MPLSTIASGAKLFDRLSHVSDMGHAYVRLLNQPLHVAGDVFQCQPGDLAFALELCGDVLAPIVPGNIGEVALIAQQVVNDEHAHFLNRLLNRLVATKLLLIEREG